MKIRKISSPLNIEIYNTKVKQFHVFKYLGYIFTEKGSPDRKAEKGNKRQTQWLKRTYFNIWWSLWKVHDWWWRVFFLPSLCSLFKYECYTWSLAFSFRRTLIACEIKCMRKVVGVTKLGRLINDHIGNKISIMACTEHIEKCKYNETRTQSTSYECIINMSLFCRAWGKKK